MSSADDTDTLDEHGQAAQPHRTDENTLDPAAVRPAYRHDGTRYDEHPAGGYAGLTPLGAPPEGEPLLRDYPPLSNGPVNHQTVPLPPPAPVPPDESRHAP